MNWHYTKLVRDADGAICQTCKAVFQGEFPWHWSKSKWMHENASGHKCKLFAYDWPEMEVEP